MVQVFRVLTLTNRATDWRPFERTYRFYPRGSKRPTILLRRSLVQLSARLSLIYLTITLLQSGNQTYMELRHRTVGLRQQSNVVIMQRSQSKILRAIANAPWHVTNHTLHTDFNIPYVSDVIHEKIYKHHIKLETHPNPLLQPLLQPVNNRGLKWCWSLELQGTWIDIARWTPYHYILIHHHISLQFFFLIANKYIKNLSNIIYSTVLPHKCRIISRQQSIFRVCLIHNS
jgi:hypothetical protein